MFKLTCVLLIIVSIVIVGCATKTEYIRIPPSKIPMPPIPQMEEDQLHYKVLKQGQNYTGEQGGSVCFDRFSYENFKIHLRQFKLWMEAVTKLIDSHNRYVDKMMEENSPKKRGWFW